MKARWIGPSALAALVLALGVGFAVAAAHDGRPMGQAVHQEQGKARMHQHMLGQMPAEMPEECLEMHAQMESMMGSGMGSVPGSGMADHHDGSGAGSSMDLGMMGPGS